MNKQCQTADEAIDNMGNWGDPNAGQDSIDIPYYCDDCNTWHLLYHYLMWVVENGRPGVEHWTHDSEGNHEFEDEVDMRLIDNISQRWFNEHERAMYDYYAWVAETGQDPLDAIVLTKRLRKGVERWVPVMAAWRNRERGIGRMVITRINGRKPQLPTDADVLLTAGAFPTNAHMGTFDFTTDGWAEMEPSINTRNDLRRAIEEAEDIAQLRAEGARWLLYRVQTFTPPTDEELVAYRKEVASSTLQKMNRPAADEYNYTADDLAFDAAREDSFNSNVYRD